MMKFLRKLFRSVDHTCIVCDVKVVDNPAHIRYKYIENDEPKIGTAFLCKTCAEDMNQYTLTETDDDQPL